MMGASPVVKVRMEKRMGKAVTVIMGLHTYGEARLEAIAKEFKSKFGAGGTVKNGVIEIQGDRVAAVKQWFKKLAVLVLWALLASPVPARAEEGSFYAVVVYRSGGSMPMVRMTACEDKASCWTFIDAVADEDIWRASNKGCLTWQQMSDDQKKMFLERPLPQPYLVYADPAGRRNVELFLGPASAAQDALLEERKAVLESRRIRNVGLIRDPSWGARRPAERSPAPLPADTHLLAPRSHAPPPKPVPTVIGRTGLRVTTGPSDVAVRFRGEYGYYSGGKRQKREVEGEGDANFPVDGQKIRSASFERTSEAGWLRLEVIEDGKTVFDAKTDENDADVSYRAGR